MSNEKSVADLHEELWDHMKAQGELWLAQHDVSVVESILNFDEYCEEEAPGQDSVMRAALEDSVSSRKRPIQQVPETILRIEEFTGRKPPGGESWDSHDGFAIVTTRQTVHLGISNYQSCCEHWGYFLTEDDTDKFVGAVLTGITVTDTNRASTELNTKHGIPVYEGDTMFVDIETDRGVLQFVAYNAHNGYYGHRASVRSTQLNHEVTL